MPTLPETSTVDTPKSDSPFGQESEVPKSHPSERETPGAMEHPVEQVPEQYHEILAKVTPTSTVTPQASSAPEETVVLDAKHIGALTDEATKVQKLLDLAETKGVVHAVRVARSLKDYYALDRMHDELAGQLYQGLLEKGLIEKE